MVFPMNQSKPSALLSFWLISANLDSTKTCGGMTFSNSIAI